MNDEFAPLYSLRERVVLVLRMLAIALPILLVAQLWFFDWLKNYSSQAHCYIYGEITGIHLVMYGVFVFIPLSSGLLVALLLGPRALRILRVGQIPLPGEKVLRKTRYRHGFAARLHSYLLLGFILFLVGLAAWGSQQAKKITAEIKPCPPDQILN